MAIGEIAAVQENAGNEEAAQDEEEPDPELSPVEPQHPQVGTPSTVTKRSASSWDMYPRSPPGGRWATQVSPFRLSVSRSKEQRARGRMYRRLGEPAMRAPAAGPRGHDRPCIFDRWILT